MDTSINNSNNKIIDDLNNIIDFNDENEMRLVINADDISEAIYMQNKPVKIYHILDYNNSSYEWNIKNQLEF